MPGTGWDDIDETGTPVPPVNTRTIGWDDIDESGQVVAPPVATGAAPPVEPVPTNTPAETQAAPWYKRLASGAADAGSAFQYGMGDVLQGQDEASAGLTGLLPGPKDPEGFERNYAAGSQYNDMRQHVLQEQDQAARESPGMFHTGQAAGVAALAGAAAPAAATMPIATGALTGGALQMAGGEGDAPTRALDMVDNPIGPVAGGAVPALAGEAAPMFKGASKALGDASARLKTHIFMTPGQRAAYTAAKGKDSLVALSNDAKAAGLYKKPWYKPLTAGSVAENADTVATTTGTKIGQFEDGLKGRNIDVNVKPIADELRAGGAEMKNLVSTAAPSDAREFTGLARRISTDPTLANESAKAAAAAAQAAKLAKVGPGPGQVAGHLKPYRQFDAIARAQEADVAKNALNANPRTTMPIEDALANKRDLASRINWMKNPNAKRTSFGTDRSQKIAWQGFKDQTIEALKADAAGDPTKTSALAGYLKDNKDFSTAKAVYDPAMRASERFSQGASARDIALAGAMGNAKGLAMLAGKSASGVLPAAESRAMAIGSGLTKVAGGLSDTVAKNPSSAAAVIERLRAENPGAKANDLYRKANDDLKRSLRGDGQE